MQQTDGERGDDDSLGLGQLGFGDSGTLGDEPTDTLDHDLVTLYYELLQHAALLARLLERARARGDLEAARYVRLAEAQHEAQVRALRRLLTARSRRRVEARQALWAPRPLDAA